MKEVKIKVVCSKCGVDLNCVCNAFEVAVHEDEYVTTCYGCLYKEQEIELRKERYARQLLEKVIKSGLRT